jgi:pyruvate dehydrogenase (quinone)
MTGAVLVDAVVSRMTRPITTGMAKGFTLYMIKAAFSGHGDDLVDLAGWNLWA